MACCLKLSSAAAHDGGLTWREQVLAIAAAAFAAADANHDDKLNLVEQATAVNEVEAAAENEVRQTLNDPQIQWRQFMISRTLPVLLSGPDGFVDRKIFGNFTIELFEAANEAVLEDLAWQTQWNDYRQCCILKVQLVLALEASDQARKSHEASEASVRHERHRLRRHLFDPAAKRRLAAAQDEMEKRQTERRAAERHVQDLTEALADHRQPDQPQGGSPIIAVRGEPTTMPRNQPAIQPVFLARREPEPQHHRERLPDERERQSREQINAAARERSSLATRDFLPDGNPSRPASAAHPSRNLFDESRNEMRASVARARDERRETQPASERQRAERIEPARPAAEKPRSAPARSQVSSSESEHHDKKK